jgi:hypothetical protein
VRRNSAITGQAHRGWSLKGSDASIDATSITHAPRSGELCRPGIRRIV